MKQISATLWVLVLMGLFTALSAGEQPSIDQQIASMHKATPQERVKLMNQFKQQLATMNAEERAKSITQLREQMQRNNSNGHVQAKYMNGDAQRNQMQQNEQLQRMEQMQQRHGGEQYQQEMMDQEHKEMGENIPNPFQKHP